MSENYNYALLNISLGDQELIEYYFFENGALGIENLKEEGNVLQIKVFFDSILLQELKNIVQQIKETIGGDVKIEIQEFETKQRENWQENWKDFFKPLKIGKNFNIIPPWEEKDNSRHNIIINPGMGFGTGYHESTKLALEMIDQVENIKEAKNIFDLGAGSGILAIAISLQNKAKVHGIDIEKEAIDEALINAKLSGVENDCSFNFTEITKVAGTFDLVIANIIAEVILELKDDILRKTTKGILLSGIYEDKKEELENAFDSLTLIKKITEGKWSSYYYEK